MKHHRLPNNIARLDPGEPFSFDCHPGVPCFTDCCRHLELALTPYDVLRLRKATQLDSAQLHQRYLIKEQTEEDVFPHFYLTMVDDGKGSCIFVSKQGCSIYEHRPSACRTYPLGRAAVRHENEIEEFYVLLQEPHCKGFGERTIQTIASFCETQKLGVYNRFNDMVTEIQQHEKIRQGMRLNHQQAELYTMALYDLDTFREKFARGNIATYDLVRDPAELDDDENLLMFGIAWLKINLFG